MKAWNAVSIIFRFALPGGPKRKTPIKLNVHYRLFFTVYFGGRPNSEIVWDKCKLYVTLLL